MDTKTPDAFDLLNLSRELACLLGSDSEAYTRAKITHHFFTDDPRAATSLITETEALRWLVEWMREEIAMPAPGRFLATEFTPDLPGALHAAISLQRICECPIGELPPNALRDLHGPIGFLISAICEAILVADIKLIRTGFKSFTGEASQETLKQSEGGL